MTTLISFLGKQSAGYRTARYRFAEGDVHEVPFFRKLSRLRNTLAHGQRSRDREINRLLADESKLHEALKRFVRELTA